MYSTRASRTDRNAAVDQNHHETRLRGLTCHSPFIIGMGQLVLLIIALRPPGGHNRHDQELG